MDILYYGYKPKYYIVIVHYIFISYIPVEFYMWWWVLLATRGKNNRIHFSTVLSAAVIIILYIPTIGISRKTTRTHNVGILYIIYIADRYPRCAPPPLRYRFYGFYDVRFIRVPLYCIISSDAVMRKLWGGRGSVEDIGLTIKSVSLNCRHRRPYTQNPFCRRPFPGRAVAATLARIRTLHDFLLNGRDCGG